MNLKKFISGISALTIAASAFAGMAVTASAVDPKYSQDFESVTTETITGVNNCSVGNNAATVTVETDSTNYLKVYGPSDRSRYANYIIDPTVASTALTDSKATLSFRTRLTCGNNAGTGNGRSGSAAIYVLPVGAAATPSASAPSEYLFSIQAFQQSAADDKNTMVLRKTYIKSGSEDVLLFENTNYTDNKDYSDTGFGITMSKSSASGTNWITVSADIDFAAGTAAIKINNKDAGTVNLQTTAKTGISGFAAEVSGKAYGTVLLDDINITTASQYTATFTETNGLNPEVTVYSDSEYTTAVEKDALIEGNTYYYKAVLAGYTTATGIIENISENKTIELTMEADARPVESVKAVYKYNGTTVKTIDLPFTEGMTVGTAYNDYYSNNYIYGDDGKWYYVSVDYNTDNDSQQLGNATPADATNNNALVKSVEDVSTPNYVITYNVAGIADNVISVIEGEDLLSGYDYKGTRYKTSGGKVASFNTRPTFYNVTESGTYQITVATRANGRHTSVFKTEAEAEAAAYVADTNETPYTAALMDVAGSNNNQYGFYTTKTVDLENGNVLTLRGYSWNKGALSASSGNDIDYIVIRKLSNTVTVDPAITGGTVEPDVPYAKAGETVTLTVTPEANYALDSITGVTATKVNDTTYTFIMPATAVTVSATFKSTVVEPSVSISAVDSTTTEYKGGTFTLAKLLVDVVGSVKAINVTYTATGATQKATDMTAITDGTIILGAIVDGTVNVTTSTFDVAVAD